MKADWCLRSQANNVQEDVKRLEENERRMRDAGFARDAALTAEHDFFMETNRKLEPSKSFVEVDEMYDATPPFLLLALTL